MKLITPTSMLTLAFDQADGDAVTYGALDKSEHEYLTLAYDKIQLMLKRNEVTDINKATTIDVSLTDTVYRYS